MRHLGNIEVGAATHTGRVRRANEDDFLVWAPQTPAEMSRVGWLVAVADGMGGAAGGAEASRTAVRAAMRPFLAAPADNGHPPDAAGRMAEGFQHAAQEVLELSQQNPNLRGMGTTLTLANLHTDRLVLGHVGDTRCLRLRRGTLEQLSVDHAVREPDNYLTRCIGAGQSTVEADVAEFDLRVGDTVLLLSDGVWSMVDSATIRRVAAALPPQPAADELVRLANQGGGPDNGTALVLRVLAGDADVAVLEADLPTEEIGQPIGPWAATGSLLPARWPWVLLLVGLAVLAVGIAKAVFGVDLLQWLRRTG